MIWGVAVSVVVILAVIVCGARYEYDGPDEPWLDWDGEEPGCESFASAGPTGTATTTSPVAPSVTSRP